MKFKVLIIEFGIKNIMLLKNQLKKVNPHIQIQSSNSFLELLEIVYMEKINLILLCDYRGKEKTAIQIRMLKSVFTFLKIIVITNRKYYKNFDKIYYIQKGADNFYHFSEHDLIRERVLDLYYLESRFSNIQYWRDSTNLIIRTLKDIYFYPDNILDILSQKTGYSASSLYHYVKEDTGKTLGTWITEMRIKGAKELLNNSNYPIHYIAKKVGYKSVQGMIKAFKKITGFTPSSFRKVEKSERKNSL